MKPARCSAATICATCSWLRVLRTRSTSAFCTASVVNARWWWTSSNYGATKVHIGAPGVGIYSTLPKSVKGTLTSGYGSYSGTSMATPHVTGAVALYASSHPGASAQQIRDAILAAAVPTASLAGKVSTGGRLDASGF